MKSFLGAVLDKTPVPYVASRKGFASGLASLGRGGIGPLDAMGVNGTVYAIVNKTSSGTASPCWHLYQKAASGKKEDRIEITRHPALILLNRPNDFFTRQEIFEATQQHIDLSGEGYWVIEFGEGTTMPIGYWNVTPARMEPVKSATEFLTGWIYKGPDGEDVPLDRQEVIQFRMPNPNDPYRGMGPIQTVLPDIESAKYASAYNRNFFLNDATPGGIVEVPNSLSDPEFDQLKARWNDNHRGVSRAHRVAFLEHGSYKPINALTQKDMQFVELSGLSSEKVREAFGFPKSMLGTTEDVNRANAEAGEYVFGKHLLVPRLDRFKGGLNNDLLPLFLGTENMEFDYDSPVTEDQVAAAAQLTSKIQAVVALVEQGYDPTVALQVMGLPDIPFLGHPGAAFTAIGG